MPKYPIIRNVRVRRAFLFDVPNAETRNLHAYNAYVERNIPFDDHDEFTCRLKSRKNLLRILVGKKNYKILCMLLLPAATSSHTQSLSLSSPLVRSPFTLHAHTINT